MDADGTRGVTAAALAALLEFVERPAAAVSSTGTVLAANEAFHRIVARCGSVPYDQISGLLDMSSTLALLAPRPAGDGERLELALRDGTRRAARVNVVPAAGGDRFLFLAFESPHASRTHGASSPLSTLRHDISSPLTAILGTAEILLVRGGPGLTPDVRGAVEQILENCGRISAILHRSRAEERGESNG